MGFHHMWQRIWERRAARCLVYHTQTKLDSWEIGRHNQSSSNFYLQGNSVCDKQDQPAVGGEHTHTHKRRRAFTRALEKAHSHWPILYHSHTQTLKAHSQQANKPSAALIANEVWYFLPCWHIFTTHTHSPHTDFP